VGRAPGHSPPVGRPMVAWVTPATGGPHPWKAPPRLAHPPGGADEALEWQ
jgi:hypothetical protein